MIVVDAHQDIAYNALYFGRDYRESARAKRVREAHAARPNGTATVGLPDALLGRVALVFATLFTAPAGAPNALSSVTPHYRTPKEAYQYAMAQLDYYNRLADETPLVRLVRTQGELTSVLATWRDGAPRAERAQGLVLLMENADPILEPKQFEDWYERGVRIVGPAWAATRYCGGTGQPGGLTDDGRRLLDVMAGFNALLDLSHMAEQAFMEALERYEGQVIASHSNPRRFRDSDRHLSDDMIRLLAERDGVIGIVPYNNFLSNTWRLGDPRSRVPFETVIAAIDSICQLTGSAAHVGIGSDLDGGFGMDSLPDGMDTVTDLYQIADGLSARGYSPADVEAVMGGNFLRKLTATLPA
jgi:membrane dipeptidase